MCLTDMPGLGMALSRLVLGGLWPTDVLAALRLDMFVPLAFSVVFDRDGVGPG